MKIYVNKHMQNYRLHLHIQLFLKKVTFKVT